MSGVILSEGATEASPLSSWEARAVEAVGGVIEFWGFKRNQGRLWTLLYLRDRALDAKTLQDQLGLSKGAVSMLTRELEQRGVLVRVRAPGHSNWLFQAETDLKKMIGRVLQEREVSFLSRIRMDLDEAVAEAEDDAGVEDAVLDRLERLRDLTALVESALKLFLDSSKLDARSAFRVLDFATAPRGKKKPRGKR